MGWLDGLTGLFDYDDFDGFDYLFVDASGDVPEQAEAFVDARLATPPSSVDTVEVWGEAHGLPDAFRTRGRFEARFDRDREDFEEHEFRLDRVDGGAAYDVAARQRYSVGGPNRDRVGTRGNAAFTLERLLTAAAERLGGALDDAIESDSYVEERDPTASPHDVLHVEYDARVDGFRDGLLAALAHGIAPERAPEGDEPVAIEDCELFVASRPDGVECTWDVGIRRHNQLFLWLLEASGYPDADALLRAKRGEDYGASTRWTMEYDAPAVSGGVDFRTTNGDAFLDRLDAAGVATPRRTSFDVEVRGRDGRVETATALDADGIRRVPLPGDLLGSDDRWLWMLPAPLAVTLAMFY